jgi:type VI secretion system protein ImpA
MIFTESQRQSLLSPLAEDSFCGVYLKSERQAFRPLRNEFNLAQTSLRKLSQNFDIDEIDALQEDNKNNWILLSESLAKVFAESSRDIELAGWMMAAQIVIDPRLGGVTQTSLWFLQPVLPTDKIKSTDESEIESEINSFKVKAFVQLLGESENSGLLYYPLLMTPLIADLDFSRYQSEEHKGNLTEIRNQYHSIALSERIQVTNLIENLVQLKNSFTAIEKKITEICKLYLISPPGFQFVIGLINKILVAIEFISGLKPAASAPLASVESDAVQTEKVHGASKNNQENAVMEEAKQVAEASFTALAEQQKFNRDKAFRQLSELADYFKKTEPHSPVAYLLDKSIRWGSMLLPELMVELLSDQKDTMDHLFNLTGLNEQSKTVRPMEKKPVAVSEQVSPQKQQKSKPSGRAQW